MFQIVESTSALLATLTTRAEKHGDEDVPAVSLGLEIEAANSLLDSIDPKLREALFKAVDEGAQDALPGVEPSTPVLRCNSIDRVQLPTKHEGWTLTIDGSLDEDTPFTFGGCTVSKFSVEPKQGGSIVLRFRVSTSDIDAESSGFLGMHVRQLIWITLTAPKPGQAPIDGTQEAFGRDHPDAGDMFAAEHGGDPDGDEGGAGAALGSDDAGKPQRGEGWPFPRDQEANAEAPPQEVTIETSRPGTRTSRGRDKMKAALAEGAQS